MPCTSGTSGPRRICEGFTAYSPGAADIDGPNAGGKNAVKKLMQSAVLMAGLGAMFVASAAPPPHAPAHGWRAKQVQQGHHRYVYYPQREIYYARDRDLWYWLDGGNWQSGARLPRNLSAFVVGGIDLALAGERPYVHHDDVRRQHPHRRGR
jgi:hypothetical protein